MARLVLPSGNGHGWKPDTPDHRDYLLSRKLAKRVALPPVVTLDQAVLDRVRVRDQGELGSCTGHGVRGCLVYGIMQRRDLADCDLSPLFAYYQGRVIEGSVGEDAGCEIRDVVKAAADLGVALESSWPYRVSRFRTKPNTSAYKTAKRHQVKLGYYRCDGADRSGTLENILQALHAGFPVTGGFSCFSNLDNGPRPGVIPMPGPRDKLEGGHAVWFCMAYLNERLLKFQNSWSTGWGNHGYGYLPFDYVLRGLADDFWAIAHE